MNDFMQLPPATQVAIIVCVTLIVIVILVLLHLENG